MSYGNNLNINWLSNSFIIMKKFGWNISVYSPEWLSVKLTEALVV